MKYLFLLLPGLLYPASVLLCQDSIPSARKQPVYVTTRLVTPRPEIDGRLDDDCWKHGTWAGDYTQFIPDEGAEPTYPTEFNVQYDEKNIYVAMRAFDGEPEKIKRMAGVRDEIVGDLMGITFDSYRDYRTGFEFTFTAWGQKVDLVLFNPSKYDLNWNAVWKVKVGLEDSAWVAEIEVPINQLRYSRNKEQVWGMHTWRWISRLSEESNWERQSKTGPGMIYNFGELRGISDLKPAKRLEIMPFTVGGIQTMNKVAGNPFTEKGLNWKGNAGLDAKIGVSSNFTIDLTVNPDFGQVESDPSVMNLTAFETFYDEKRPFFLEGLTIFNFDFKEQNIFYSRRIGHSPSREIMPSENLFVKAPDKTSILSAVKFSGTTSKGLSVGLIQSVTATEHAKLSDGYGNTGTTIVEPLTGYTIGRIQQGFNSGNTIAGAMITSVNRFIDAPSLEFLSNNAFTGGLDLLHHMKDKEFFLDVKLTSSHINGSKESIRRIQESSAHYFQRPGREYLGYDTLKTSLSGSGGRFRIGKGSKGFWRYSTGITWATPGLELNDLGYLRMADEINQENEISYLITKPVSVFHSYDITLQQFNSWNFRGSYLGSGSHLSFNSEFNNNWKLSANVIYNSTQLDTRLLRGGPEMKIPSRIMLFGGMSTDQSKTIIGSFNWQNSTRLQNSGSSYEFQPGISVRPFGALKLGFTADYSKNRDDLQYVTAVNYFFYESTGYILGAIDQTTLGVTFRVDVNISPELSVQYYASPFVSRGEYSDYKLVNDPLAGDYSERFTVYTNSIKGTTTVNLNQWSEPLVIRNPDFNFQQFRSNLVARFEYSPGSFIYFVWSGDMTQRLNSAGDSVWKSLRLLRDAYSTNVFMIKLNYWFSL